jgi:hypothetical protein
LKVFGIAVTDFEEMTAALVTQLKPLDSLAQAPTSTRESVEQWLKQSRQVTARWFEVTQWLVSTQAQAQAELARVMGAGP